MVHCASTDMSIMETDGELMPMFMMRFAVATGMSKATERPFNLVVAFERGADKHGNHCGRAIAESSFARQPL